MFQNLLETKRCGTCRWIRKLTTAADVGDSDYLIVDWYAWTIIYGEKSDFPTARL